MLDAALRKAAAVWVSVAGHPARLVWTAWFDGALWLMVDGGEQDVPGLVNGASCTVVLRSPSTRSRLLDVTAVAHRITPDSPEWDIALPVLTAARLNAAADAERQWAEATVYRLDLI